MNKFYLKKYILYINMSYTIDTDIINKNIEMGRKQINRVYKTDEEKR